MCQFGVCIFFTRYFLTQTFLTQIVGATAGHLIEPQDSPCCEGENNVLAHVPSVKLETRSPKGDDTMTIGGSDDEGIKPAISEEALSR